MGRAAVKPTNDVAGKDAGESEGHVVMAWIRVQNLPDAKASKLPAGVSSRENWINNFHMGKQMAADFGLAGAPISGNVWLLPVSIVKSVQRCAGGSPCQGEPLRCLSLLR